MIRGYPIGKTIDPSTLWWSLELDDIALGVRDIDRRALSLGAIAQDDRAGGDAVCFEMAMHAGLVKRVYPKAEMIEVPSFLSRCCAAGFAELAIYRHEIDDRSARSQLNQADLVLASLDRASKNLAVEAKHPVDVDNAQYKVIDFADTDHRCVAYRLRVFNSPESRSSSPFPPSPASAR